MSRETISNVDLALLRMDDPKNLMIITALMILETPLDVGDLKETIQRALLCYPRFCQRVIEPKFSVQKPYWQEDRHFDLNNHIERIRIEMPASQSLLQHLIGKLMSIPLDPRRPLWKFYLVEHYGGGSAVIARLHHSIADGIALTRVLLSMTDSSPDGHIQKMTARDLGNGKYPAKQAGLGKNVIELGIGLMETGSKALANPQDFFEEARQGLETAAAMGRFVMRWPDPKTVFKGKLGKEKLAVWSKPISLNDIKKIGRNYGATVNDVLLTIVAGALRQYLLERGESVEQGNLHSFIPVNLRPEELFDTLGNKFGLVFLSLPTNVEDPLMRLQAIKENMDGLKSSPEAVATMGLFHLLGAAPRIQKVALSIFDSKGTAVTTNVPGPQKQLYLAGAPINTLMAWVPKSGHVGLGISIISYNGSVWIGVTTDAGLVPDPEHIIESFHSEFITLQTISKQKPPAQHKALSSALEMLDKALHTMDEILISIDPSQPLAKTDKKTLNTSRCQASTISGTACKNRPLSGEPYCRVHFKKRVKTTVPVPN